MKILQSILWTCLFTTFVVWMFGPISTLSAAPKNEDQVTICHYPPGNPGNAHTITVGESAVQAHIDQHGDTLGACAVSSNDCNECDYSSEDYQSGGCAHTCGPLIK